MISETWLDEEDSVRVGNYNIIRRDREDGYGGVCILFHKSVKIIQKNVRMTNTNIEIIYVQILNIAGINNIIFLYSPPTITTNQSDWDQIFRIAGTGTLVSGDFNRRGEMIYQAMFENNYMCLNNGAATRIRIADGNWQQSSPDISFVTTDIAIKFTWYSTNESLGSDHIVIKLTYGYERLHLYTKKRNYKKAKWKEFQEVCEQHFSNLPILNDVQSSYDTFVNKLDYAAEEAIPWIKICQDPNNKFRPKPYWDSNISKAVAERRLALAKLRRNPTPENYKMYKEKLGFAQNLITTARYKKLDRVLYKYWLRDIYH
ncbi:uncharacterized protein LOC113506865 [Trichoplusia ni]|uniref:Uncharacterized protein LOC113506865 n=1 Tax=Trichoplusia ni TaxID=7111 RepID=A0A7E5WXD2_TRINI|nr:uncharacterized protein LOC113506865 [Trichoplusia ni]